MRAGKRKLVQYAKKRKLFHYAKRRKDRVAAKTERVDRAAHEMAKPDPPPPPIPRGTQ